MFPITVEPWTSPPAGDTKAENQCYQALFDLFSTTRRRRRHGWHLPTAGPLAAASALSLHTAAAEWLPQTERARWFLRQTIVRLSESARRAKAERARDLICDMLFLLALAPAHRPKNVTPRDYRFYLEVLRPHLEDLVQRLSAARLLRGRARDRAYAAARRWYGGQEPYWAHLIDVTLLDPTRPRVPTIDQFARSMIAAHFEISPDTLAQTLQPSRQRRQR